MDSIQANEIRAQLQAVLKDFAEKNGLSVGSLNGRFDGTTIDFKFKCSLAETSKDSKGATVDPKYRAALQRHGFKFGLTEDMIGKQLVLQINGSLVKVEFLGMSGYTKAVVKEVASGKVWLYRAEALIKHFK